MTRIAPATPTNPLATLARALPVRTLQAASIAARVIGGALVLFYAFDQYQQFDRTFAATWVFTVAVAVIALVTAIPSRQRWAPLVQACGAAILLFGGAALSREPSGAAAVICGIVAWLSTTAIHEQEGAPVGYSVSGLLLGAMGTLGLAVATALAVSG